MPAVAALETIGSPHLFYWNSAVIGVNAMKRFAVLMLLAISAPTAASAVEVGVGRYGVEVRPSRPHGYYRDRSNCRELRAACRKGRATAVAIGNCVADAGHRLRPSTRAAALVRRLYIGGFQNPSRKRTVLPFYV